MEQGLNNNRNGKKKKKTLYKMIEAIPTLPTKFTKFIERKKQNATTYRCKYLLTVQPKDWHWSIAKLKKRHGKTKQDVYIFEFKGSNTVVGLCKFMWKKHSLTGLLQSEKIQKEWLMVYHVLPQFAFSVYFWLKNPKH